MRIELWYELKKDIQHTQKENENTNYEMIKEEEKK
jgi:hypothetical protein